MNSIIIIIIIIIIMIASRYGTLILSVCLVRRKS